MFRFLFCLGYWIDWQICESVKPCQITGVLAGGKPSLVRREEGVHQQDCGVDDRYCSLRRADARRPIFPLQSFDRCICGLF